MPTFRGGIRFDGRATRARRRVFNVEMMEERTLLSTAAFQLTQDWGSGFGGQITITNTQSSSVNNWSLAFDFDKSITTIWDGVVASHVGNHYVVNNAGWNANIAGSGGTAEFGFNGATGNVGTDKPTNFVLNGVPLGQSGPSLSVNNASVSEGGIAGTTPMTFTVTLSTPSTKTVTVSYSTADVTAKAGTNYKAATGTLTFNPGVVSKMVTISGINNLAPSPNETFDLKLSNPTNASVANGTGVGTIIDTIPRPPTATNDVLQTNEGTAGTVNVLANDTDPNGYALSVVSFTQGTHGTVTAGAGGNLTYVPAAKYVGSDSFQYTVSDGHGETAVGKVSVNVVAPSAAGVWPSHVFAPYVDMTLYPTYNLVAAAQSHGLKYFTLAFVVADTSNNLPSWGGYTSYDVNGGAFDKAIQSQISALRQLGGDVMVSFGGANGQELAQAITSVSALTAAYEQVINEYGLTHIDFDIEGSAEADVASIARRSQSLAAVEHDAAAAGRTLEVSFTLPVLPTGLTSDGLAVLQSALKYGVVISGVNVMTMDFGDSAAPNPSGQMGQYVIESGQSLFNQLKGLYGTTKSDSQLWSMVGLTPMIGVNDVNTEVFTLADAQTVTNWAKQKGSGRISMWSLNRDLSDPAGALHWAEATSSSIVQQPFDFSKIFRTFTS